VSVANFHRHRHACRRNQPARPLREKRALAFPQSGRPGRGRPQRRKVITGDEPSGDLIYSRPGMPVRQACSHHSTCLLRGGCLCPPKRCAGNKRLTCRPPFKGLARISRNARRLATKSREYNDRVCGFQSRPLEIIQTIDSLQTRRRGWDGLAQPHRIQRIYYERPPYNAH
jgi:hypothetical protein